MDKKIVAGISGALALIVVIAVSFTLGVSAGKAHEKTALLKTNRVLTAGYRSKRGFKKDFSQHTWGKKNGKATKATQSKGAAKSETKSKSSSSKSSSSK